MTRRTPLPPMTAPRPVGGATAATHVNVSPNNRVLDELRVEAAFRLEFVQRRNGARLRLSIEGHRAEGRRIR